MSTRFPATATTCTAIATPVRPLRLEASRPSARATDSVPTPYGSPYLSSVGTGVGLDRLREAKNTVAPVNGRRPWRSSRSTAVLGSPFPARWPVSGRDWQSQPQAFLSCEAVRWVNDEPQPGLVEVRFTDARRQQWAFIGKWPVFTDGDGLAPTPTASPPAAPPRQPLPAAPRTPPLVLHPLRRPCPRRPCVRPAHLDDADRQIPGGVGRADREGRSRPRSIAPP